MGYLNNPSAVVDWRDVIEVLYTLPTALTSSQKTQCPICMEPAGFMVAPRVTKCGHLFCYACLLQYLDFEKEYAWKKCPLCSDPIYKRDIRKASIIFDPSEKLVANNLGSNQTNEESKGSVDTTPKELTFRLVVRNKSNIVSKLKNGPNNIATKQD